jgi:hypothetical protein
MLCYLLFPYFSSMKRCVLFITLFISYNSVAQPKWQQQVDTKIDVTLDDRKHMLSAYEEFTYTNNSPDTLRFLYIHLWPNAYKSDRTPFARQLDLNGNTSFYYSKVKNRGYIDSLQFAVDGQSVDYYSVENVPDIARIDLIQPLLPGHKIVVTTPFKVKLPTVFSRNGHTGQAYYVSQWFPKPAVYDQKGWHPISYLDQGEFFSEYGSYDVNITLPVNYVLMATGNCMDAAEQRRMDSLAGLPFPSDTLYESSTPASALETKTVRYSEHNIHDFAWFADKRFVVRKDTAYSPGTNDLVTTWAAFLPSYQGVWQHATTYLKNAIDHYGKWVGPYPYKTMKAVLGDMKSGGGMEYPTITLIDKTAKSNLKTVVIHEAGHNWFYGLLGSNERDHAWMDEGINTFYEQKTTNVTSSDSGKVAKPKLDEALLYYELAATDIDQPIDITSAKYTKTNYGMDVYYKTALMLNWLEQYMGVADFGKGMKDYYDTWRYHHPYPEDFRVCMQRHTTKSLDWFFDTILNTDKKIDFKITKAKVNGGATQVTVRNNSGVNSPVLVNAYKGDSLTASVWSEPFDGSATLTMPVDTWDKLKVASEVPDAKSTNNVYRRHALFHHFGLKLKPILGINRSDKDKVFITPSWGNNQYDGIMLGIALHNLTIPQNRFRFAVSPMYSFATKSLVGAGSVGYIWYPRNLFKEVMLQADAKTFHMDETLVNLKEPLYARYIKVAPSLNFIFNEHDAQSTVTRSLLFKEYNISEDTIAYGHDTTSIPALKTKQSIYGLIRYMHRNDRVYNPFSYSIEGQGGADFAKINIEGNARIDYNSKNKSLYIRAFVGKFFAINDDPAISSRYELNATYGGSDDYLYDGTYRARNAVNGFGARQISAVQEGGFKIPVFNQVYRSDNWMATINLKTDLPLGSAPVRLFFDAGLIPNPNPGFKNPGGTTLMYDGGVEVYIVKDIISLYVPLIMSGDFRDYLTNTFGRKNVFGRSISFTFQVQNINWLKTPSKLLKSVLN